MVQTTVTTDPLLNNNSTLSGLLSQLDTSLGGNFSSDNLFSNLLSEDSGSEASSLPIIPPVTAQATNQSSLTTTSTTSASTFLQNLTDLSSKLNKLIQLVRQQNAHTPSTSSSQAMQTQTTENSTTTATNQVAPQGTTYFKNAGTSSSVAATPTNSSSAVTTDTTGTDSSTDVKKTITDILSELLLLTQMVMKDLQQAQKTAAGSSTASSTDSTSVGASTDANGSSSLSNSLMQLIAALEKTAQTLQTPSSGSLSTTSAAAAQGTANATPAALVAQENDISNFVDNVLEVLKEDLNTQAASAQKTVDAKTTNVSDILDQLASIDSGLKNVLSLLQPQKQTTATTTKASVTAEQEISVPAPAVVPETTLPLPSTTVSVPTKTLSAEATIKQGAAAAPTPQNATSVSPSTSQTQTFVASEAYVASGQQNTGNSGFSTDLNEGRQEQTVVATTNVDTTISAEGAQAAGTYNFASTLSALRALNGGTTGLPSVVDQVILQMNRNVKNGNDQMSIQLQPGDLGKITVKLNFGGDGKVQGTVTADNPQTLNMLQKDSRSLERALQDAGLRADPGSLQFNLGGQTGHNTGQTAQNNANNSAEDGTNTANGSLEEGGLVDISAATETYYITPNGVNIQV
jgi:hypothetical protein